jgi:hypothetical protein
MRSGNTMDEEVGYAFAQLEGTEFDPASLGMNVSFDASGGMVVTAPPRSNARRSSAPPPRAGGADGMAGSGASTPTGGSMRGGANLVPPSPNGSVENSRHGPSDLGDVRAQLARERAASAAGGETALAPASSIKGSPRAAPPRPPPSVLSPAALAATQAAAASAAQRDRRSFVARLRDPETGAMSNLRLFGGNVGASTAMTRSIGDAGAARCCIAEPEFCTVLVAPAQRARLIIASDGLWDVYANEEAENLSRGSRMDAPRSSAACAALLAARALEDRSFDGLAADDITTVVMDIRGGGLAGAGGPSGACCTLM